MSFEMKQLVRGKAKVNLSGGESLGHDLNTHQRTGMN